MNRILTRSALVLALLSVGIVPALATVAAESEPPSIVGALDQFEPVSEPYALTATPPDGRPWAVLIFKACCTVNAMAVKWTENLHEKYGDQIGFLGVTIDTDRSLPKALKWLKSKKVAFPVVWNPEGQAAKILKLRSTPLVVILDENGAEIYRSSTLTGKATQEIETLLDARLAARKAAEPTE